MPQDKHQKLLQRTSCGHEHSTIADQHELLHQQTLCGLQFQPGLLQVITLGDKHPLTFGREVLAELVGKPERADWRSCQVSLAHLAFWSVGPGTPAAGCVGLC